MGLAIIIIIMIIYYTILYYTILSYVYYTVLYYTILIVRYYMAGVDSCTRSLLGNSSHTMAAAATNLSDTGTPYTV